MAGASSGLLFSGIKAAVAFMSSISSGILSSSGMAVKLTRPLRPSRLPDRTYIRSRESCCRSRCCFLTAVSRLRFSVRLRLMPVKPASLRHSPSLA